MKRIDISAGINEPGPHIAYPITGRGIDVRKRGSRGKKPPYDETSRTIRYTDRYGNVHSSTER